MFQFRGHCHGDNPAEEKPPDEKHGSVTDPTFDVRRVVRSQVCDRPRQETPRRDCTSRRRQTGNGVSSKDRFIAAGGFLQSSRGRSPGNWKGERDFRIQVVWEPCKRNRLFRNSNHPSAARQPTFQIQRKRLGLALLRNASRDLSHSGLDMAAPPATTPSPEVARSFE